MSVRSISLMDQNYPTSFAKVDPEYLALQFTGACAVYYNVDGTEVVDILGTGGTGLGIALTGQNNVAVSLTGLQYVVNSNVVYTGDGQSVQVTGLTGSGANAVYQLSNLEPFVPNVSVTGATSNVSVTWSGNVAEISVDTGSAPPVNVTGGTANVTVNQTGYSGGTQYIVSVNDSQSTQINVTGGTYVTVLQNAYASGGTQYQIYNDMTFTGGTTNVTFGYSGNEVVLSVLDSQSTEINVTGANNFVTVTQSAYGVGGTMFIVQDNLVITGATSNVTVVYTGTQALIAVDDGQSTEINVTGADNFVTVTQSAYGVGGTMFIVQDNLIVTGGTSNVTVVYSGIQAVVNVADGQNTQINVTGKNSLITVVETGYDVGGTQFVITNNMDITGGTNNVGVVYSGNAVFISVMDGQNTQINVTGGDEFISVQQTAYDVGGTMFVVRDLMTVTGATPNVGILYAGSEVQISVIDSTGPTGPSVTGPTGAASTVTGPTGAQPAYVNLTSGGTVTSGNGPCFISNAFLGSNGITIDSQLISLPTDASLWIPYNFAFTSAQEVTIYTAS